MKRHFLLIASLFCIFNIANAADLQSGVYATDGNFCDLKVTVDSQNNSVEVTTVSSATAVCRGNLVGLGKRLEDSSYLLIWKDKETNIDATIIAKCEPKPELAKPCDEIAYENDKLIAKAGDIFRPVAKLELVDDKAITLIQGGVLEREGSVYKTKF